VEDHVITNVEVEVVMVEQALKEEEVRMVLTVLRHNL
jgi:hypothetical protein